MSIAFGAFVGGSAHEGSGNLSIFFIEAVPKNAQMFVFCSTDDPDLGASGTTGSTYYHSIQDTKGNTYRKVFEQMGGTVAGGEDSACLSVWHCHVTNALTTSDSLELTLFNQSVVAKAIIANTFTVAAGKTLELMGLATVNGLGGSATIFRVGSDSLNFPTALLLGAVGWEGPGTDDLPAPTNYTSLNTAGTTNVADGVNVSVGGAYRLWDEATAGSHAYNPSLSRDGARIFTAWWEKDYIPPRAGISPVTLIG